MGGVLVAVVGALVAVAWSTLLERKLLAGFQLRKGPNNMSAKGAAQPLGDAVNLLLKGVPVPSLAGSVFWGAPLFSLTITLIMWSIFPPVGLTLALGFVGFLCLSSVHVLGVLGAGWGSNSVFSSLAAARAVSLVLSYEIPLVVFIFAVWLIRQDLSLEWGGGLFAGGAIFGAVGWIICLLVAETHRAPFDFVEAESELVSGFNVEYGAWGFVLLFLAEYGALLFTAEIVILLLCPGVGMLLGSAAAMFIATSILCARAAYPRVKVPHMMSSSWGVAVPLSLVVFLSVGGLL